MHETTQYPQLVSESINFLLAEVVDVFCLSVMEVRTLPSHLLLYCSPSGKHSSQEGLFMRTGECPVHYK